MVRFSLAVLVVAFLVVAANCAVILGVRAPIGAEYWVRETLIVKRAQVATIEEPKLLFVGGSSTLFSVDSDRVAEALGRPAYNFGLHASMRLDWLLDEARRAARPGDTIVLMPEPPFFDCRAEHWSNWQLRNAIAWEPAYLEAEPWTTRIHAALTGGSPSMALELLRAKTGSPAGLLPRRRASLAPQAEILARHAAAGPASEFAYSPNNLTPRGDMRHTDAALYKGPPADPALPAGVCPSVGKSLQRFTAEMAARKVRVLLDHTPYLTEGDDDWREADAAFTHDLAGFGLTMLSPRQELFFARDLFLDTDLHLNAAGRAIRTTRLIAALKAAGV